MRVVLKRVMVKRIVLVVAAAIAAVFGSIALWAGVASAWHPVIDETTACLNEGRWTVQWKVGNSETVAGRIMTFDSVKVNGVSISLTPSNVAPGASATGTSTHTAAIDSATLVVHARWVNSIPDETASAQTTVVKPECVVTTTTTVAPTTTTVAPTTTTVAPTTTTVAPTTTTVAPTTTVAVVTTQAGAQVEAGQVSAEATANALPATGNSSTTLIGAGASLLLIGLALVLAARRRGTAV